MVDVSAFGGHAEAGERCDELQANGCALELLSTSKAGIPFPGTTYPEVNRLGQVTLLDSVTRLGNGDLDVPGLGRIRAGFFTRTDRGVFGSGSLTPEILLVQTTEDEPTDTAVLALREALSGWAL